MINTFFAIINQLRFLQKISGFYQMGLHPDYRKDMYEPVSYTHLYITSSKIKIHIAIFKPIGIAFVF